MADARYDIGRRERGLLDLRKIVLRIAVELKHADLDQRIVLVRPHLGEVEGIVPMLADIALRHHLYEELPLREIALANRFEEIALMRFAIVRDPLGRLGIGPIPDPLLGL